MSARVVLVLGHGRREPSLCHHLARRLEEMLIEGGAQVRRQDLLADGFDPVLRLAREEAHATAVDPARDPLCARYQEDVRWATAFVFVHPVWWFAVPAILKGWIDRVLVDGVALEQHEGDPPKPRLAGRRALVVQTFNAAKAVEKVWFRGVSAFVWRRVVLPSVGIEDVRVEALFEVERLDGKALAAFERRLERRVERLLAP